MMRTKEKPRYDSFAYGDPKKAKNHHHMQYAELYPHIAYRRFKNGKMFVYDNRKCYHGQLPIARIDDTHAPSYHLIVGDNIVCKGTIKELLAYATEKLL